MPNREGIETLMALHREQPGLPIIAMSGGIAHSQLYLAMAARLGARRTLAKPFTPEVLLHAVDEVLAESRGSGPAP
jgi:DNA-binding NarL/FixJ family response regulator